MDEERDFQQNLIDARRKHILDAAINVFAEKGFHRATIKDVAKAAGIADGTIYNYFENKSALLIGIMHRLNETELRGVQLAQGTDMDMKAFMRAYMRQRLETLMPDYEKLRVLLSEILVNPELREQYYQQVIAPTYATAEPLFDQLIASGKVKALNSGMILRVIAGSFLGLLVMRMLGDDVLDARWDELPDLLAEVFMSGLEVDKGADDGADES